MAHHGQVVGDKNQRQAHLPAQLGEKVKDLGLDRDIEGRDRLVGDDDFGAQGQGAGDRYPLALAAGEFVGVLPGEARGQADCAHQLIDPGPDLALGADAVGEQGLGERRVHGHPRVERRIGILEDHLHLAPAGQQLGPGRAAQVAAPEEHGAPGRRHELEDRARERRLSAAGFPHQAQHLALADGKRDAIHRADGARLAPEEETLVDGEIGPDIPQFEDVLGRRAGGRVSHPSGSPRPASGCRRGHGRAPPQGGPARPPCIDPPRSRSAAQRRSREAASIRPAAAPGC